MYIGLGALMLVLLIVGCSTKETVWSMEYIQGKDGKVIYCSNKNKDIYPNAEIKSIECILKGDKVTISNKDTKEQWIGNYEVIGEDSKSTIYEVKFADNSTVNMVKSFTEYEDKTKVDTLIISNKEYVLNLTLN